MTFERIAFFGKRKARTRETFFMVKALRELGKKVLFLNPAAIKKKVWVRDSCGAILRKLSHFKPDLLISYSKDIPYKIMAELKGRVPIAMFWPDYVEPLESDPDLVRKAALSDVFLMTNRGLRPHFARIGVTHPLFCPQACDDRLHRPIRPYRRYWCSDVAFVGHPRGLFRDSVLKAVGEKFQLKLWGGDWSHLGLAFRSRDVRPRAFAKICTGSSVMLGCDCSNQIECYFSFRTWQVLGCGGFLLTNYVPGLQELFKNHEHLVWYRSVEECLDLIAYYLPRESERREIRTRGYEFVHRTRTYPVMVRELLELVAKELQAKGLWCRT